MESIGQAKSFNVSYLLVGLNTDSHKLLRTSGSLLTDPPPPHRTFLASSQWGLEILHYITPHIAGNSS